ncbi:CHASE domain-containing protein [Lysobacter capsici]|uniref:CHASE domain-containing protein n=1 Tax=Lysobacter capsici TaxID=435897 RepID=UPI00177C566E|nr:CHASE domain-containing protein [Lysobacter capsici]UOF17145.1 CHASE domain-containing protein [Lysobacter capsici]
MTTNDPAARAAPPHDPAAYSDLSGLTPRRGYLLAFIVFIVALVLVLTAWRIARDREQRSAQAEFVAQTVQVTELIQQRLVNYELVARGGVSLFASVQRPTAAQWKAYVEGMNLQRRFPATLGLGFTGYVPQRLLVQLQNEWRDAGYGLLTVRPFGQREIYGPVLYLEPKTPANVETIGYDMFSEATRHAAMEAALESGQARLSGKIQLLQDKREGVTSTGMILVLPVYLGGGRPLNPSLRRAEMQGWVYVPFRMEKFVEMSLGKSHREMRFRIYDDSAGGDTLLFRTAGPAPTQPAAFVHKATFDVYGRTWRIEYESPPIEEAAPRMQGLRNLFALGIFTSLLLYGIALVLAHTESRARQIASRMTEDFRRSETRFRSAMQYSAIGKALLDSEGRIVDANPALAAIVGMELPRLLDQRFDTLLEDEDGESPAHGRGSSDEDGVLRATRRLRRQHGVARQVQLTYSPVPGKVGQDITGLVQVEDVTERLRAEARVHALNRTLEARVALRTRELSQANQELEAFAYSVSHDLRAPLRAIDGFSRILGEKYADRLDESGSGYLARVRKAAARMGDLIDALLKMSRVTRSELKHESVDLSRVANELIEELRMGDAQREVEARIEPGLEVVGDASLLRNLLGNLLGNAWKFTRDRTPGLIEFGTADAPGGGREFFVRDNGTGFPQAYVDKLFRPFQRLHSVEDYAGHGIGLASVKRIVERHGGTIRAEGREGEGATFYFTLPREGGHA